LFSQSLRSALILGAVVLSWALLRNWSEPPPDLDPATYDHSVNSHGRLFLLQRKGYGDVFLFGTFHSADPRVLELPSSVEEALARADLLASESLSVRIEALDDDPMTGDGAAYGTSQEDFKNFCWEDGSLREALGAQLFERLEKAISAAPLRDRFGQLSVEQLDRLTAACVISVIEMPETESVRLRGNARILDDELLFLADRQGKAIVRLETFSEQRDFMLSKPNPLLIEDLERALDAVESAGSEELWQEWIDMYLQGYVDTARWLSQLSPANAEYWLEAGIVARNRRMAANILDLADERTILVATGAAHLAGEEGIVNLLAREGYSVTVLEPPR